MSRLILTAAILAVLGGCSAASRGEPVTAPAQVGPALARATASEAGGLRVLFNGPGGRGGGAFIARTRSELAALWSEIDLPGPVPAVDLSTHLVLARSGGGGVCPDEITSATVDVAGTLTLQEEPLHSMCILLLTTETRVIAIPRRILPPRFVWRLDGKRAVAFQRGPAAAADKPPATPPTLERRSIAAPLGIVALPPAGTVALRSLDDARQVWVVHRADRSISVVAADMPLRERGRETATPLRGLVSWSPEFRRFSPGHDSAGRSVLGQGPLETFTHARIGADRLAIGRPAPAGAAPVEPRSAAPGLDGEQRPYAGVPPTALAALQPGRYAVVGESVVFGTRGPPRLCTLPEAPKLRAHFAGCPSTAPAIAGLPEGNGRGRAVLNGPVVVRLGADGRVDRLIGTGAGESFSTVERTLQPPAPRGPSRPRATLAIGRPAGGDSRGARDGHAPTCVPAAAQGAPDEVWTFRPPATATYHLQVDADHDVALAIVDPAGREVACNDDRHGYYRSALVRAPLTAGTSYRVIVDGFGGQAGAYRLRAGRDRPLAGGGVLAIGVEVAGDTRGAPDARSESCHAPAPDDTYRLEITRAGKYRILATGDGWTPLVSLPGRFCGYGRSEVPGANLHEVALEPGSYEVVVDGNEEQAQGRYRLRVDRVAD